MVMPLVMVMVMVVVVLIAIVVVIVLIVVIDVAVLHVGTEESELGITTVNTECLHLTWLFFCSDLIGKSELHLGKRRRRRSRSRRKVLEFLVFLLFRSPVLSLTKRLKQEHRALLFSQASYRQKKKMYMYIYIVNILFLFCFVLLKDNKNP